MINENEKIYYICQQCSEQESCNYYHKVITTIKEFLDTPLNIHFPMCKKYQSALYKTLTDIENSEIIPECNDDMIKVISESFRNYLEKSK